MRCANRIYSFYLSDRTPGLADESPAPETSFIGQECNATTKYYARGKNADDIPPEVFQLFPAAKRLLTSGFFAVQEIPKVLPKEQNITKVRLTKVVEFCMIGRTRKSRW